MKILSFEIKGLDNLKKKFTQMQKAAEELERTKSISFDQLFTSAFMQKYTNFLSFKEFLKAGNFDVNSQEDFEAIPDEELDAHVKNSTKFSTWKEMLNEATKIFISKKLGF